jgi:hypothetical protein
LLCLDAADIQEGEIKSYLDSFLIMYNALEWGAKKGGNTLVKIILISLLVLIIFGLGSVAHAQQQTRSTPVGIEGTIPSDAPKDAPIITVPSTGNNFTRLPVTVAGLCTKGLLVEVFKNGVFAGSADCSNGSFTLSIDLFDGRNDLLARHYDALNQPGPDSKVVTVNFNDALARTGPRISVTTNYAKRGADPNQTLTWPITISGGVGPFAISVDWGDKTPPDLLSESDGGDINLQHTYTFAGVYNVTIKVTDSNGEAAFLQLVGIANGPTQQGTSQKAKQNNVQIKKVIVWWPFAILLVLTIVAFWLGSRHQLAVIRERLRRGERPFK